MSRAPTRSLVCRTRPIDDVDLLAELRTDDLLWTRLGDGLVGRGVAARIEVPLGPGRAGAMTQSLADAFGTFEVEGDLDIPGTGPVAFGSLTFDPATPGSVLVIPEVVLGRRDGASWVTTIGAPAPAGGAAPPRSPGKIRYAGSTVGEVPWLEAVALATQDVASGRLDKIVLARDLLVWSEDDLDVPALAARLASRFPDCYTFVSDGFMGATPELLVSRLNGVVHSLVLAGSAPRGADASEDDRLGGDLLTSTKDLREHALSVTSVCDSLEPLVGDLITEDNPTLLKLANVQHLATRVHGRADASLSALELAEALHPTAAVCGSPADAALARIQELEGIERGRYAGPVGWVDSRGDGEWGIALRCAEVEGRRARLFAGAGIVEGSIPERELEETRLKLRAVQEALEGGAN